MELLDLLELHSKIKSTGVRLYEIATEMDSLTGLISALDSTFDQAIFDQGKNLPNELARKLYRERLQDNDEAYLEWKSKLAELKLEKMMVGYERDSVKIELDLHMLDIRRSTSKLEADTIAKQIDNTNYLEAIKQTESFSK